MIRLAIAGAGYIANIHARAAQRLPYVSLTAVVERYPAKAKAFAREYHVPRLYKKVDQLLADGDVDAIIIGTPNFLHFSQTVAALHAGLHVMVEKPMAMNSRQAFQMLQASQTSNRILMVAHCWRFDPDVLWLREQLNAGKIGKIIRTKGYGVHQLWGPSGWFTQKKLAGGGALADMGIHAIDTARFLLGDPQPHSVYANIGTYYTKSGVDDTGIMIINWDGGTSSYIESGWWQPHTDGPEAGTQLYGTSGFGQLFPTYYSDQSGKFDSGFTFPRAEHAPQSLYDTQMAYFIHSIQENRIPTPGGVEGWINMKIIDAAYKSARTGKVIKVK